MVLVSGLRETGERTQVTHIHTQHTQTEAKLASAGFYIEGPIKSSLFGGTVVFVCQRTTLMVTFTYFWLLIRLKTNVRSFVSNDLHNRLIRVGDGQQGL